MYFSLLDHFPNYRRICDFQGALVFLNEESDAKFPVFNRSQSHSENDRRRPGRSRAVLKSASELLSNDMVYCGLARDSNGHDDDDDDDDDRDSSEVFVGVDDARSVIEEEN